MTFILGVVVGVAGVKYGPAAVAAAVAYVRSKFGA